MAQRNEESISPMARSPRSVSPVHINANDSAAVPLSSLRTAVAADESPKTTRDLPSTTSNGSAKKTPNEAFDYMNGGIPHNGMAPQSPLHPTTATYPQRQSALKQSTGPPSSFPAEAIPMSAGASTPPGRRSVQFVRTDPALDLTGNVRQDSWGNDDGEIPSKDRRGPSLISKLKALASTGGLQTHVRSQSYPTNPIEDSGSAPVTPAADRSRFPYTLQEEGSDVDADAEETADESAADASRVKKKASNAKTSSDYKWKPNCSKYPWCTERRAS